jgi:hypothetical protein
MKSTINHLVSVSKTVKKSSIFGAMELRDGYFICARAGGLEREIHRCSSRNYSYDDFQNEMDNFDLQAFIKENSKRVDQCLDYIGQDINEYESGVKNRFWILKKNFCFNKTFDKPVWTLEYTTSSNDDELSLDELHSICDMLNKTKANIIKRCETYWKKYGSDKIEWYFHNSNLD